MGLGFRGLGLREANECMLPVNVLTWVGTGTRTVKPQNLNHKPQAPNPKPL